MSKKFQQKAVHEFCFFALFQETQKISLTDIPAVATVSNESILSKLKSADCRMKRSFRFKISYHNGWASPNSFATEEQIDTKF